MHLSKKEYTHHSQTMDLRLIAKPQPFDQHRRHANTPSGEIEIPAGFGLYELRSGCANLTEDHRCSIYSTRPQCCRAFEVGSPECLQARREAGLDGGPGAAAAPLDRTQNLVRVFFPTLGDPTNSTNSHAAIVRPTPPSLDEIAALVARNGTWIHDRLAGCDAGSWSRRTRCAPWTVGALAAHLVDGQALAYRVLTAALKGGDALTPPNFHGDQASTVAAFTRVKNEVVDAITRITPDMLEREVVLDKVAAVTLEHLVEVVATELAVHGLDLADALHETRHLTTDDTRVIASALPDLLDVAATPRPDTSYILRSLTFELALTWRKAEWRCELGPDPCWIEGEPESVLLFALGREPFRESRLSTNSAARARAFRRYFCGP